MNWKLIFQLSLFGLAMGIATVYVIPSNIEPAFWLMIFLICAYLIARGTAGAGAHFLHGFLVSMVNSVWITVAHVLFFDRYIAGHAQEVAMMKTWSLPASRGAMALVGPGFGVLFGIILGIFALVAGKLVKSAPVPSSKVTA